MNTIIRTLQEFPRQGAALDTVKLVACLLMVVDHINLIFLDLHPVLWLLGRMVFPLFCFIVAVHVLRGIEPKRYLLKLLPFAVLSQIPYVWMLWDVIFSGNPAAIVLNVIFTLGIGGVLATLFRDKKNVFVGLCLFVALIGELFMPSTIFEFGLFGLLLPLVTVRLLQGSVNGFNLMAVLICLGLCNVQLDGSILLSFGGAFVWQDFMGSFGVSFFASLFMAVGSFHVLRHISEADLGEKSRFMPRYFFHVFYPSHLAIIAALSYFSVFS